MSRVIIVGAGLGGLTAAYLLDQAGHDVTVLEARLRPGGRVRTLREPFADGLYAEAGGAFVSPGHANVTRWCEHFGLDLDPFPPAKARAIRDLRYSSTTRTYVQTRTRFWSEPWSFFTTDEPVSMVRHVTFNQPGPRGIVESYVSGPRGRLAATATEPERVGSTVRGLERIFPGFATQAEGGASYSWFTDPWARGSEAWYAPGEEVANFPHHPTTEGRIHFAGEHTELAAGMNGAIGSGQRVAREIEGLLVKRGGPDQ